MKRVVQGKFTFECGRHTCPLQGPPKVLSVSDRHEYVVYLSDMLCPTYEALIKAEPDGEVMACDDSWRVWLDG